MVCFYCLFIAYLLSMSGLRSPLPLPLELPVKTIHHMTAINKGRLFVFRFRIAPALNQLGNFRCPLVIEAVKDALRSFFFD